jgi:hypothetical protein
LVAEYKASGSTWRRSVQTTLRASYTSHYRKGLIRLLEVLAFRSSNTAHQPVIQALGLIRRYAHDGNTRYYPLGEHVPVHGATLGDWQELVWRADRRGRRRVVRMAYEIATFQALRDAVRCKEIWVEGADRWRNPDQDLPADFEDRRVEHYQALRKPLDPSRFIDELKAELRGELAALNDALPRLAWVDIADRPGGAVRLSPLEVAPEPRNLRRLKREVERRWGVVPLIDMLKEAALRTGCLWGGDRRSPAALTWTRRCWPSGCCCACTPTAPTPACARSPPATTATAKTTCGMCGAGSCRPRPPAPWRSSWPTPPSPPASRPSGARVPPRSPATPPTWAPSTRTSSPSGTRATAAAGC